VLAEIADAAFIAATHAFGLACPEAVQRDGERAMTPLAA
jgi:hypothetical protein